MNKKKIIYKKKKTKTLGFNFLLTIKEEPVPPENRTKSLDRDTLKVRWIEYQLNIFLLNVFTQPFNQKVFWGAFYVSDNVLGSLSPDAQNQIKPRFCTKLRQQRHTWSQLSRALLQNLQA